MTNEKIKVKTSGKLSITSDLSTGTGDVQNILDEILQIIHKYQIKETNDHFYQQSI